MSRARMALLLLAGCFAACDGCLGSGGDGAADHEGCGGSRPRDAGWVEDRPDAGCLLCEPLPTRDAEPPTPTCRPQDESGCGCLGPFRRCGCGCDEGQQCVEPLDVCVRADSEGDGTELEPCTLLKWRAPGDAGPPTAAQSYCSGGRYCAVGAPQRVQPSDGGVQMDDAGGASLDPPGYDWEWHGYCVPASYCRDARRVPPSEAEGLAQCRYSDGTPFVEGTDGAVSCPSQSPVPGTPFCGGSCPPLDCGFLFHCVGVSEQRHFGMCLPVLFPLCVEGSETRLNDAVLALCAAGSEQPCACLVPTPQPAWDVEVGWAVPVSLCARYRAAFPDSVRCLGPDWRPLL